jgi:hypothetical protein
MVVDESTEYYLINSMGLTKQQIKDMLPSEVEDYCDKVIRERISARGIYKPKEKPKN